MPKFFLFFIFFINCFSGAVSLDYILKFDDAVSLNQYIKQQSHYIFLKILCERQKENKKPPTACYELSLPADSWCLSLKIRDLNLEILNQALQSSFLTSVCREHLKEKQKILLYRKKDFLLPELKNYWTAQKHFF